LPLVIFFIRDRPEAVGLTGEGGAPGAASAAAVAAPDWHTRAVLSSRTFQLIVLAFLPFAMAFGAAQQNLGPYAADQGLVASSAATLISVLALTMVFAKIAFGACADRVDHRWLFLAALAFCAVALAQMGMTLSYRRLLLVSACLGVAAGGFLPLLGAVVSARFGVGAFGRVMGLVGPFTTLAAIGPWLAARLRDSNGSYDAAWPLMLGLLVLSAIAIVFLPGAQATRERHPAPQP
ncbi:MAG: MFS transporter, partial [Pseudomonadota bacterium]